MALNVLLVSVQPAPDPYNTATQLIAPTTAVLGESVMLQAVVTSQAGVPAGAVSFQDGDTEIGTAQLDATGNANFSATGLALGTHAIAAYYVVNDPYYASQSASSTLTVYAYPPGVALSLSANSLRLLMELPRPPSRCKLLRSRVSLHAELQLHWFARRHDL